ncbi:SEC-C domain-containing protein [Shewanella sp. KX20019]|nr:SEC-C domain-containing protein [Shewanella sp. KX20019]
MDPTRPCPCCSLKTYNDCCQPLHLGVKALNPEQLMRSRFSAFYLGLFAYLIDTHHKNYLFDLTQQTLSDGPQPHWLTLDVISSNVIGDQGTVTFQAWFRDNKSNALDAIHEYSNFIKENGRWYYTDGVQKDPVYPKRNALCVCGSSKKFKQCCL